MTPEGLLIQFAACVVAAMLFRLVTWRLERLDRQVTPRMKRGSRSAWLLLPATLAAAGCVWWCGHPEAARWIVALTAGLPFLLATERFWGRLLGRRVSCDQCGNLGRLPVGQAVDAMQLHRDLLGHSTEMR